MSHQRYPSHGDAVKEPHSVSLKVLRLSRPSLVTQYPIQPPPSLSSSAADTVTTYRHPPPIAASLAYSPDSLNQPDDSPRNNNRSPGESTNPDPFILSPIFNLPPSFGSAYVGETFSCTLCVNHDTLLLPPGGEGGGYDALPSSAGLRPPPPTSQQHQQQEAKTIRDVRIEAEMKTPATAASLSIPPGSSAATATKLALLPAGPGTTKDGVDLAPGQTLQKIVNFDLKDEGNHVLAVTVSYYEATETSGRTRTFRKLYQFICKAGLIVRTKAGRLGGGEIGKGRGRRWVLEAQLENCGEDVVQLERVVLDLEGGLVYRDCNWEVLGIGEKGEGEGGLVVKKPVLHPGEVEHVCFVIEEVVPGGEGEGEGEGEAGGVVKEVDGRIMFGVLGIGWRSEMGNRGFLSTGRLGTRFV